MRPHIKFLDQRTVPPQPLGQHGITMQLLSRDPDSGASTMLVTIPPGWKGGGVAHYHSSYEEAYIISGDVTLNGRDYYRAGSYLYRPAYIVHGHNESSIEGCTCIVKFGGEFDMHLVPEPASLDEYPLRPSGDARPHQLHLDTARMEWSWGGEGANRAGRKMLSVDPESGEFAMLLHLPAGWRGKAGAHYHTVTEEVYVLEGDVALDDEPVYREGCYLFRPPQIIHGPKERSEAGCLALIWGGGTMDFHYVKDMDDPHALPWE